MRRALALLLLAVVVLGAAACGDDEGSAAAGDDGTTLTVFAASSLKEAFTTIGAQFEAANPGVTVAFQFAGSDELATQLEEGAPADVYAAASPKYPQQLAEAGVVGQPDAFATNTLVLAVPAGSAIADAGAIGQDGVKVVIGAEGVPIGDYTRKVLDALATSEGAGYGERVRGNVVSEEQSVKGIVAKLVSGDADAGFVYITDVRAAGDALRAIPLPADAEPGVSYEIATVEKAPHGELADRFVQAVLGAQGQGALGAAGFGPAPTG